jgi:predicted extracellular nuclease
VEAAFGPNSPSPGREPIVGHFNINGKEVVIIGNHFKSKGGDDPLFGVNQPPIRKTETQRKAQALVVRNFVDTIYNSDPKALIIVAGDLNDFEFGEPGEGSDHPLAILKGDLNQTPLFNLIDYVWKPLRYTYNYDGNSQVLDHILISPALLKHFRGKNILHFNSDYPASLTNDPTTSIRSSDHDPIELRLKF